MKIKILIASYTDWVIIAILALALCFAAAKSFVFKDNKLDELKTEIAGYEQTINNKIKSADILPMPKTDYLSALRDRFEHMPVISPYQRNPFLPPKEIVYSLTQIKQKASREIKLNGVRLMEQVSPVEEVAAKFTYNADDDYTKVVLTGIHTTTNECSIRIRDDLEQVYRFPVRVYATPQLPPPMPPVNVRILERGPYDAPVAGKGYERRPAAVLITFQPDNPQPMPMNVGTTTGAVIYRKPADSPDTVWRKLHKKDWIAVATPEEARDALSAFTADKRARPATSAPRPAARPVGPEVAQAAPEVPVAAPAAVDPSQLVLTIPQNSFVYLDQDVEPNESYLYKIETVSTAPDAVPAVCKEPTISPSATTIPSLVQMTLVAVTARYAKIRLTRPNPEGGEPYSDEFNVAPGMKIGGKVKHKPATGVDAGGRGQVKEVIVDYSTDCILVDAVPKVREMAYRQPFTLDRSGRLVFKLIRSEEPRIYYLTPPPRGFLRMKSKDETPAVTPGAGAAPVAPGVPPGIPGRP